jgi:predicted RNA-binding protein associated with RNAse of E/G family
VLNRKFADLRHAPELDPRVVTCDATGCPQSVVSLGPAARRKTKGGLVLAEPGFTWALFFFPGQWYTITSVYDRGGQLVAHHVDLGLPAEDRDGILSFLDLKLDLLIQPDGTRAWLDQDDYEREVAAGTIAAAWQVSVAEAVAALDRDCGAGVFPPPAVAGYRPSPPRRGDPATPAAGPAAHAT